jgi:hypothetical protein
MKAIKKLMEVEKDKSVTIKSLPLVEKVNCLTHFEFVSDLVPSDSFGLG